MKNETIEGNKLIAIFMGWIKSPYDNTLNKVYSKDLLEGKHLQYFCYDESWDELMPVVEKIESLGFRVEIIGLTCSIYTNSEENIYVDEPAMTKTEATWQSVVEFIKWYNSQTHNP